MGWHIQSYVQNHAVANHFWITPRLVKIKRLSVIVSFKNTNLIPFVHVHQAANHYRSAHMEPTNQPPSWSGLRMQQCVDCGAGYNFLHQLKRHRARASHPLQLLTTFMNDTLIPVLPDSIIVASPSGP